jgi:hypothetical protein
LAHRKGNKGCFFFFNEKLKSFLWKNVAEHI